MSDRTRNRDEESRADVAERHQPAAPPENAHHQKADRADTSDE